MLVSAVSLSHPLRDLTRPIGTLIEGVGVLMNHTGVFAFQVFHGVRTEVATTHRGVKVSSLHAENVAWCSEGTPVTEVTRPLRRFELAYPDSSLRIRSMLALTLDGLAGGSRKVKHIAKNYHVQGGNSITDGSAGLVLGRREGKLLTVCVSFTSFELQLKWESLAYRLTSAPDATDPQVQERLHKSVKLMLLSALRSDFPQALQVTYEEDRSDDRKSIPTLNSHFGELPSSN